MFSGKCYTREALEAILRFCNKHNIHLISDEIYAQSVYGMSSAYTEFTSVLSIDMTGVINENLVHVMYGMSKVR
jgi:xeroderma pigmentosum group C-complementing protein